MGLIDLLRPGKDTIADTRSALEAAEDPSGNDGAIGRLVTLILGAGLDGTGPISSAREVAEEARRESGDVEAAVAKVARQHLLGGALGGFATSLGGFVTMPVALPVNVLEFYVQATRMVGAIAILRGYDINDPKIRTAVLLTLVGSNADDVLAKAGMTTGGGRLASLAMKNMPPGAILMVNKAIGFRLLKGAGGKLVGRLGRGVPLVGGVVGGGIDGFMMKRIADHAMQEFPSKVS